jgi:hypothetical protein
MAVEIRAASIFDAGVPRVLLQAPLDSAVSVSAEGQRFLMSSPLREPRPEPIQIVLNWTSETRP